MTSNGVSPGNDGPAALSAALAWIESAGADAVPQLDELIETRERQLVLLRSIRDGLATPVQRTAGRPYQSSALPKMPRPTTGDVVLPDPRVTEQTTPNPFEDDEQPRRGSGRPVKHVSPETREQIARLIHEHGPLTVPALRALAHVGNSTAYEAVKHAWFEMDTGKVTLTQLCYAELLRKDG